MRVLCSAKVSIKAKRLSLFSFHMLLHDVHLTYPSIRIKENLLSYVKMSNKSIRYSLENKVHIWLSNQTVSLFSPFIRFLLDRYCLLSAGPSRIAHFCSICQVLAPSDRTSRIPTLASWSPDHPSTISSLRSCLVDGCFRAFWNVKHFEGDVGRQVQLHVGQPVDDLYRVPKTWTKAQWLVIYCYLL